jgi:hypothetical protein
MNPVSAVIIAQNEERKVREAIESVRFCDEVGQQIDSTVRSDGSINSRGLSEREI